MRLVRVLVFEKFQIDIHVSENFQQHLAEGNYIPMRKLRKKKKGTSQSISKTMHK